MLKNFASICLLSVLSVKKAEGISVKKAEGFSQPINFLAQMKGGGTIDDDFEVESGYPEAYTPYFGIARSSRPEAT